MNLWWLVLVEALVILALLARIWWLDEKAESDGRKLAALRWYIEELEAERDAMRAALAATRSAQREAGKLLRLPRKESA